MTFTVKPELATCAGRFYPGYALHCSQCEPSRLSRHGTHFTAEQLGARYDREPGLHVHRARCRRCRFTVVETRGAVCFFCEPGPNAQPCCRCGGAGQEGNIGEPYDSAFALDTCYHCCGAGVCACPRAEVLTFGDEDGTLFADPDLYPTLMEVF